MAPDDKLECRVIALCAHDGTIDHRVDLFGAGNVATRQYQTVAIDHQLGIRPIGKGACPALIIDRVQTFEQRRHPICGRVHVEGADQAQRFVIGGPCQGDRISPPLPFDSHRYLVFRNAVKVPVMMLGDVLNDIDRVDVVFKILLGQGHDAASCYLCGRAGFALPFGACSRGCGEMPSPYYICCMARAVA